MNEISGWLCIAGLGPGDEHLVTPEVSAALAEATDVVGYIPYVARIAPRDGLTLHPSDNRVELDRARAALAMAGHSRAARHHRHAGGSGQGRRAARPRFLRHQSERQPETRRVD